MSKERPGNFRSYHRGRPSKPQVDIYYPDQEMSILDTGRPANIDGVLSDLRKLKRPPQRKGQK